MCFTSAERVGRRMSPNSRLSGGGEGFAGVGVEELLMPTLSGVELLVVLAQHFEDELGLDAHLLVVGESSLHRLLLVFVVHEAGGADAESLNLLEHELRAVDPDGLLDRQVGRGRRRGIHALQRN